MADPILVKISELDELTSTDGADQLPIVDASEPNVTIKTKRVRMDKLRLTAAAQLADGIVANSKLANSSVTTEKLAPVSVTTEKVDNLAIIGTKLAPAAVTAGKIASGGVSDSNQIADGIVTSSKLANGVVTEAKLANNSVTELKLGTIKRTVIIKVIGTKDVVAVENIQNVLAWSVSLNNFVVIDARINLAKASTSGSVTVALTNQGGTMSTLSIPAGQTGMSASGSISSAYRKAVTNAFLSANITSAGTDAEGLSITLVLEGIPE